MVAAYPAWEAAAEEDCPASEVLAAQADRAGHRAGQDKVKAGSVDQTEASAASDWEAAVREGVSG